MTEKLIKNCKTSRKDRALLALLESPTLERAADAVGVHPTTLRRWLRQPEFQEALRNAGARNSFKRWGYCTWAPARP